MEHIEEDNYQEHIEEDNYQENSLDQTMLKSKQVKSNIPFLHHTKVHIKCNTCNYSFNFAKSNYQLHLHLNHARTIQEAIHFIQKPQTITNYIFFYCSLQQLKKNTFQMISKNYFISYQLQRQSLNHHYENYRAIKYCQRNIKDIQEICCHFIKLINSSEIYYLDYKYLSVFLSISTCQQVDITNFSLVSSNNKIINFYINNKSFVSNQYSDIKYDIESYEKKFHQQKFMQRIYRYLQALFLGQV